MPLTLGARLGPYEIVAPLGAGGMGEVYRARDSRLRRDIAIKVLPAELTSSPDRLARLEREATTVAGLNHPNIVVIHTIEEDGAIRFLTMELVEGRNLADLVTPGGLPIAQLLDLGIPLADALVAAHEKGVIHRDLKPANVMVTREGRVKVLDFGLAKLAQTQSDVDVSQAATLAAPISEIGQIVGTMPYMAPEQIRGEVVDARSDLFSLGVLIYELAGGKRPFTGQSHADVSSAILRDTPPSLASLRGDLPSELAHVVERCLEKSPRERFQTALDVLNELRSIQRTIERGVAASRPTSDKIASIAVLPFVNRSASTDDEYFSDGLADELLNVLAKIKGLRVVARTSSFQFKGTKDDIATIGARLDVATVLEGSVRKAGPRVRISVQLVRVADSSHLWSESYDRTLDDIFAVQDDIARSVVKELRTTLFGEEQEITVRRHPDNAEAYQRYLRGRYHWYQMAPERIAKSREFFEQAIALDPGYALAYCGLADYYGFASAFGMLLPDEGWPKAESAARKALELDDSLGEAYNPLAALTWMYYRDWQGAERMLQRGISLSPQFAEIHLLHAFYLAAAGRFDESIEEGKRGLALDPLSLRHSRYLGNWFYYARRHDEALTYYANALELDPDSALVHEDVGNALEQKGLFAEAVAAWRRALTLAGDGELATILEAAFTTGGFAAAMRATATKTLHRLNERRATGGYVSAIEFARASVRLGDDDQAFEWLAKACHERTVGPLFLKTDPLYDRLRPDPRFEELLRSVGLTRSSSHPAS